MVHARIVACATLDDLGTVAALVGSTPDALRGEIAAFPEGVEWVALQRGGAVVAAGIRVERTDPPALVRLCLEEGAAPEAVEPLVAMIEVEAARRGSDRARVGLRRAPGVDAWLRARGYVPSDRWLEMARDGPPAPVPPLPAGIVERGLDEVGPAAFLAVHDQAFRGSPGHVSLSPDDWERIAREPGFDPDLARVLSDEAGPLGLLRGALPPGGEGVVEVIGLAPRARGRGLGRYLLRRTEALLRARGAAVIGLTVAESNRAALALYRAEGYRERDRREVWEGPSRQARPT